MQRPCFTESKSADEKRAESGGSMVSGDYSAITDVRVTAKQKNEMALPAAKNADEKNPAHTVR